MKAKGAIDTPNEQCTLAYGRPEGVAELGLRPFPNGDSFKEQYADDRKNGAGVHKYANGAKLTGKWDNDEFVDGSWELDGKRMSFNTVVTKLKKRTSLSPKAPSSKNGIFN